MLYVWELELAHVITEAEQSRDLRLQAGDPGKPVV